MSSFKGRMGLYTNVCLDRFDGINLRCTAFFLSHCHKDHMAGLDDKKFEEALKSRNYVFLYCTEITRLLLLADEEYKPLEEFIKILDVGTAHYIKIPKDHVGRGGCEVTVTAVSAGHCPGSVMFLFEGDQGTCLYTGDFCWEANYASKVAAFGTSERVKAIDHLYIDTTFCVPAACHIPSRVECADATVSMVALWLERSPQHQVAFFCPARYGYEFLLREIATRLGVKIHVPAFKARLYEKIPDLCGLFTSEPTAARIHACCAKMRSNPSRLPPCLSRASNTNKPKPGGGERCIEPEIQVLNIRPCAMWFTAKTGRAGLERLLNVPASPRGLQRVCYSMHSSFSEIQDLVSYLQPQYVWPNVIPASDHTPEKVQARLNSFLKMMHPLRPKVARAEKSQDHHINLEALESVSGVANTKSSLFTLVAHGSDSSDGCVFDSQGSEKSEDVALVANGSNARQETAESSVQEEETQHQESSPLQPQIVYSYDGDEDSDLHLRLSDEDTEAAGDSQDKTDESVSISECIGDHKEILPQGAVIYEEQNRLTSCEKVYKRETVKNILQEENNALCSQQPSSMESHHEISPLLQGICSKCTDGRISDTLHKAENSDKDGLQKTFDEEKGENEEEEGEDENDSEIIDSSPVSPTKKGTILLKGKPCKVFLSSHRSCHCQNYPKNTSETEQGTSLSSCINAKMTERSSCKQSKMSCDITSIPFVDCPSLLGSKRLHEGPISFNASPKKLKLSPARTSEDYPVKEGELHCKRMGNLERERVKKEGGMNEPPVTTEEVVYVVHSDSEDDEEDSDKLLKPSRNSSQSSNEPWVKKKQEITKFIDLTKDL